MAHSYHHALSSARQFGGTAADYIAVHEWFDGSKAILADFRHRSLRHHEIGILDAMETFGESIVNADGVHVPVEQLGEQHCQEDFRQVPDFAAWAACVVIQHWMSTSPTLRRDNDPAKVLDWHCHASQKQWGGRPEDFEALHRWIDGHGADSDIRHCLLRHHAQGAFEAQRIFGQTLTLSSGREVPVRLLVENHLTAEFGNIPGFTNWALAIQPEPWMMKAQPLHKQVDPYAAAS